MSDPLPGAWSCSKVSAQHPESRRRELRLCRAWQPDSIGTGGVVLDDWLAINWDKINSLTGGTKDWADGVGAACWLNAMLSVFAAVHRTISAA